MFSSSIAYFVVASVVARSFHSDFRLRVLRFYRIFLFTGLFFLFSVSLYRPAARSRRPNGTSRALIETTASFFSLSLVICLFICLKAFVCFLFVCVCVCLSVGKSYLSFALIWIAFYPLSPTTSAETRFKRWKKKLGKKKEKTNSNLHENRHISVLLDHPMMNEHFFL